MVLTPPRYKGPPLNALRAFEAAARLGGFSAAAEELNVTAGAIAQHIKSVEAWAGAKLFERKAQGVHLTDFGRSIVDDFTIAFDRVGDAVQALREKATTKSLRIAALPAVAQMWLPPRLQKIRDILGVETVSVSAMERRPNLKREPYDMSFFYTENSEKGSLFHLEDDIIVPVCAPTIARAIGSANDFKEQNLLHDTGWRSDWETWFEKAAPDVRCSTQGPSFSLYDIAIKEAVNAAGILIGHETLVRPYLESGELVAPVNNKVRLDRSLMMDASRTIRNAPVFDELLLGLRAIG